MRERLDDEMDRLEGGERIHHADGITCVDKVTAVRRKRAGSWSHFERRFRPVVRDDGSLIWHNEEIPRPIVGRNWWTVLDCDGKLYVSAGFRFVNRIGYIRTEVEWTKADEMRDWTF